MDKKFIKDTIMEMFESGELKVEVCAEKDANSYGEYIDLTVSVSGRKQGMLEELSFDNFRLDL